MATGERSPLDISVFILSYNRAEYLREALLAVLRQDRGPSEVVVLDNGSQPMVKEKVHDLLERPVRWEGAETTHSPFWNIYRAFALAKGKYLAILHDDDRICPTFIREQCDFLERHPEAVAVGCNALLIDERGERKGTMLKNGSEAEQLFRSGAQMALQYTKSSNPPFPSYVYRNGFPQRVRFKEEFGKVADCPFICELAELGPVGFLNRPLMEYRVHAGQDSVTYPEDSLRARDRMLVEMGTKDAAVRREILSKISKDQTIRAFETWRREVLTEKRYGAMFRVACNVRPEYFSLSGGLYAIKSMLVERIYSRTS
ncbi:MAG: glycosyltransferase family A protein [Methanomassiliicoccales archaeon]|nr:glycosyltransferase family A protein [Methanomassiliicoccales archaeon]